MSIVINKKTYSCLYDVAKEYEIKLTYLIDRYDLGYRGKELIRKEKTKQYNKPKNLINFKGQKHSLSYLSKKYNVDYKVMSKRHHRGWKDDRLINPTPSSLKNKFIMFGNEYYRISYLSKKHGITMSKLARQYKVFD